MSGFRLVEAGISGGGPLTLAHVYPGLDDACTAAERMLDQLEPYRHRRPWAYRVVDVETGELVTTVYPDSRWDPDPFAPTVPGGSDSQQGLPVLVAEPGEQGPGTGTPGSSPSLPFMGSGAAASRVAEASPPPRPAYPEPRPPVPPDPLPDGDGDGGP